jgi:hypothetical protein
MVSLFIRSQVSASDNTPEIHAFHFQIGSAVHLDVEAAVPTATNSALREKDLAMALVTVRAAKSAPKAKRMTGPKLFAAAIPTK